MIEIEITAKKVKINSSYYIVIEERVISAEESIANAYKKYKLQCYSHFYILHCFSTVEVLEF